MAAVRPGRWQSDSRTLSIPSDAVCWDAVRSRAVAIPDFQTIMRPLLVAIEDGQERTSAEIRAALATEFSLTEEELAEMIPSGRAKTFANRVAWAITHTYQARLLERPRRSVYRITPRGTEVLAAQARPC